MFKITVEGGPLASNAALTLELAGALQTLNARIEFVVEGPGLTLDAIEEARSRLEGLRVRVFVKGPG
jgi:hypothetical protein